MDFFEAVAKRRSIRRFKPDPFPDELVRKALEAAVLAPNSSNIQTWDFHWIKNPKLKSEVVKCLFSQSAARTASQIIVVTSNRRNWRRSRSRLVEWVKQAKAHPRVVQYYDKAIPITYTAGFFSIYSPVKFLSSFAVGLFRPISRGPFLAKEIDLVGVKSAALASENFVLAITALGGATCMMEGFDEWRMKWLLRLPWTSRVVMAIGIGYEGENGTWGPQYRLPLEEVVHVHE